MVTSLKEATMSSITNTENLVHNLFHTATKYFISK